ncbi:MAG: tetrahydromethanopterin S-methyltransferase [Anaerolineae bacterium]
MFRFDRRQKVWSIAGIKVGGQPGENPPLLMANMFQRGDKLLKSRKKLLFDRVKARERIRELEAMSSATGVPALVGLVAPTLEEMRAYSELFLGESDKLPFGIDTWTEKARRQAARYVAEIGMQERFLYNSITAWDEDIPDQVQELKDLGIKHVILQPFDMEDKRASGRIKSLRQMLEVVHEGDFESVLVDTTVMNLPAHGFSLTANRLVKEEFGLPAGNAPANGSYMWKECLLQWGARAFRGMDAGLHALSVVLWSDWLIYGPMTGTKRIFAAVAAATAVLSIMAYEEGAPLPESESHPLNLLFSEMAKQLREG